jgi:hypothetical protein
MADASRTYFLVAEDFALSASGGLRASAQVVFGPHQRGVVGVRVGPGRAINGVPRRVATSTPRPDRKQVVGKF